MSLEDDESVLDLTEQTQRPADVAVKQQRIQAWHPILDPEWVIYSFLILAAIAIPVGKKKKDKKRQKQERKMKYALLLIYVLS